MIGGKNNKQHFPKVALRVVKVATYQNKVWVPENYRKEVIEFHYKNLQHWGEEMILQTVWHNFKWPGWTGQIAQAVKWCKLYQEYIIMGQI
eukprot:14286862-Ditylum_brightwellii.AAC.1